MPLGKKDDGTPRVFPLERYCLEPGHAILLEGVTYPPERRSSMAMSLGSMTQLLQMVITEGRFRAKWENAEKRTLQHLPCIDDFIALSKTAKISSLIGPVVRLYADLSLLVTTRYSQRGSITLTMLADTYTHYSTKEDGTPHQEEMLS